MESNVHIMDSLVKKIGFPGEHMAGILVKDLLVIKGYPVGVYLVSTPERIFWHGECGFQLMKEQILDAVEKGELTPRQYALMHEWSFNTFSKSKRWWDKYYTAPCAAGVRDKRYNQFINDDQYSTDIEFVDRCRNEIGMCSVFHEKKMKAFAEQYHLILRFGDGGLF